MKGNEKSAATVARSEVEMVHIPDKHDGETKRSAPWRGMLREQALANAMQKRATGVPTYSVQEAAALLSISQEYLYRLIQRGSFPAVRMRLSGAKGRYVVPAQAVERLLTEAAVSATSTEIAEWAAKYALRTRAVGEA
jgi:excisionase family DNA binding protein